MEYAIQALPTQTQHRSALGAIVQALEDQIDALLSMPETPKINTLLTSLSVQVEQLRSSMSEYNRR
jgi:hypothetical protein